MDIQIRSISESEVNLLHKVALQTYEDHFTHIWEDAGIQYMRESFDLDILKKDLQDINHRYFLAIHDGEVLGYMKLKMNRAIANFSVREAMELERIYIRKKATGQGIGKKFMVVALEQAQKNEKSCLWLKAMDSSSASIAFYEAQGFKLIDKDVLDWPLIRPEYKGMVVLLKYLK